MRKNNNITLAQVMKYNASKRGVINETALADFLQEFMWNSGYYESENCYCQGTVRINLYPDGVEIETLWINPESGKEWYNNDAMFFFNYDMPKAYREIKKLYRKRGLVYTDILFLNTSWGK